MRIAICSDLHLEFGDIRFSNTENAEVLILGGDIMIAQDLHDYPVDEIFTNPTPRQRKVQEYREFLKHCSNEFNHVIYVAGNHEFYHGKFVDSLRVLREECQQFPNVYFLENQTKEIGDVTFIGATLWTDCNKGDPVTLHALQDLMNDFQIIRHDEYGYRKLRPMDIALRHKKTLEYIKHVVANVVSNRKVMVVGHHSPSKLSTHPRYQNEVIMNGAYSSDLSEFILDHPQIVAWSHGHTHSPFDYYIGSTRIICNPRGYVGYEVESDNFQLKFVDI
jgi:predicted phosphodiesterase